MSASRKKSFGSVRVIILCSDQVIFMTKTRENLCVLRILTPSLRELTRFQGQHSFYQKLRPPSSVKAALHEEFFNQMSDLAHMKSSDWSTCSCRHSYNYVMICAGSFVSSVPVLVITLIKTIIV